MELLEYADAEMMMIDIANKIAGELREHLAASDFATLAVPGGTTPGPIFDVLCAADLDWGRVKILLTDERWVPEDHPRSNTRLVRDRLLTDRAGAATLVPLHADATTPEEKLDGLAAAIADLLPLSVVLLGMGTDMHTASIFPGADRLDDALHGDEVLVPMRAPGAPEPRVTLAAPVLNGAIRRHIVIVGQEKRDALERARSLTAEEAPVMAVLKDSVVHWADS